MSGSSNRTMCIRPLLTTTGHRLTFGPVEQGKGGNQIRLFQQAVSKTSFSNLFPYDE